MNTFFGKFTEKFKSTLDEYFCESVDSSWRFLQGTPNFQEKKGFNFKLEDLEHLLKAQLAHSEKRWNFLKHEYKCFNKFKFGVEKYHRTSVIIRLIKICIHNTQSVIFMSRKSLMENQVESNRFALLSNEWNA